MSKLDFNDPRWEAFFEARGAARVEKASTSWFVIGNSGREGDDWKVFFESGDEAEAREFFWKRVRGNNRYSKRYKYTSLMYGSAFWGEQRLNVGLPYVAGEPTDWRSEQRAAEEREARDERRTRKEARKKQVRIAEPEAPRVRVAVPFEEPIAVLAENEELAEQEAQDAMPRMRIALKQETTT